MSSMREQVLAALFKALQAGFVTKVCSNIERGDVLPERIPEGGLIILRDGKPGEPEVTLSPLMYSYRHRADIEVFVQSADADRDKRFDDIAVQIGAALALDRTLGGLCDWAEAQAPDPGDLPVAGGATIKAAVIPVILHYSTSDPLN